MLMKLASSNVFRQSKVHLHSHKDYDICAHSSLPTSAILALGLLEERKDDDEQFFLGGDNGFLGYLALHRHIILLVLKAATNADTAIENAYTVKSA